MKKDLILSFGVLVLLIANNIKADDLLTGDTKLSCEAILCLSSSTRPSECNPSLQRYFSITAKKWKDTVRKRKSFLQLCPTNSDTNSIASKSYTAEDQAQFENYRDNVLASSTSQCTAEALNQNIETSYGDTFGYRINPNIPSTCNAIYDSVYSDIAKPTYICNGKYSSDLEEVKKTSCWVDGVK
jgi:hypothetical protein